MLLYNAAVMPGVRTDLDMRTDLEIVAPSRQQPGWDEHYRFAGK
jgi:hypothetical protein